LLLYVLQEANHEDASGYVTACAPRVRPSSIQEANQDTASVPHVGPSSIPMGTFISVPNRESGDTFAVLPALIRVSFIIGIIAAGIVYMLVCTTESWLGVFKVYKGEFLLHLYCATAGILVGHSAVLAFWAALQSNEEAKELFVNFNEDSLRVLLFASRVPVTTGNNTEHQAQGSKDALVVLTNFIIVRAAYGSTIAAGIVALLLYITAFCWLLLFEFDLFEFDERFLSLMLYAYMSILVVGVGIASFMGELAVADFLRTLKLYKAT
jgi:hypothetical protein